MNNYSGFVRHVRHRAKKFDLVADITIDDVSEIASSGDCDFCDGLASRLRFAFSLRNGGPCCPANVIHVCEECFQKYRHLDLLELFHEGRLAESVFLGLVARLVGRRGGGLLKSHMRQLMGIEVPEGVHN